MPREADGHAKSHRGYGQRSEVATDRPRRSVSGDTYTPPVGAPAAVVSFTPRDDAVTLYAPSIPC